jgi:hypothetical protein
MSEPNQIEQDYIESHLSTINENSTDTAQNINGTLDIEDCKLKQDQDDDSENQPEQDYIDSHLSTINENSTDTPQNINGTLDIEDCKFIYNENDNSEQRIEKRKLAVEYICQFEDISSLMESEQFLPAINNIIDCSSHEKFESIHLNESVKERFISMLMNILQSKYTFFVDNLQKSDDHALSIEVEDDLKSKLDFINSLSKVLKVYSEASYEFNMILIGKTEGASFFVQVLQNSNVHEIIQINEKFDKCYSQVIDSILTALRSTMYFYNHFKQILSFINFKMLLELSKTLNNFFNVKSDQLLSLVLFVLSYDDDNELETHNKFRNVFMNRNKMKIDQILSEINTFDDFYKSRVALNMFVISSTTVSCEYFSKFIKLSINFIKNSHLTLVEYLKNFNTENSEYQDVFDKIINTSLILRRILILIEFNADKSIEFCIQFHDEEGENGIKVILDFMNDKEILSIFLNNQGNFLIKYLAYPSFGRLFFSLLSLSRASYKYKDKWSDLKAINILKSLSSKISSIHNNYQNVTMMIIANIASEEDLNNLSVSLNLLEYITSYVKIIAKALDDDEYEISRGTYIIDETDDTVLVLVHEGWNLILLIEALHKFSINDTNKSKIYEKLKLKEDLRKIIYNGNEFEKEYAFKLLNQLCFDDNIALDVKNDKKLINFMKGKDKFIRPNLRKYIDGILWLIHEDNRNTKAEKVNLKQIFISYNSESRKLCFKIKER